MNLSLRIITNVTRIETTTRGTTRTNCGTGRQQGRTQPKVQSHRRRNDKSRTRRSKPKSTTKLGKIDSSSISIMTTGFIFVQTRLATNRRMRDGLKARKFKLNERSKINGRHKHSKQ